jgi:outer membrane receptor protein involved in Fe transport
MFVPLRPPVGVAAVVVLGCLLAVPTAAQFGQSTGGIHGKVVDEHAGVLAAVTVTVKGPGAANTVATDARGEFHLVNLSPGIYTLVLAREGFADVSRENVTVALGRDTELTIMMPLSTVTARITVSDEAPLIDTRRVETGAAVTRQELRDIPTARDPWVILRTIPGVQVDSVNVAGSESGSQSVISTRGTRGVTFQVDGVNTTDMAGGGTSSVYYDFDSFQEMEVVTGGSDPSIKGSGAHLNMITKRGTNVLHGSARLFAVDDHFESNNLPSEAVGQGLTSGNHIHSIQDWGAEVGGPVWKDHLWLWGSYGRDQINLVPAGGGGQDETRLEDFNAKLNGQIVPSNSVEVWYLKSDKLKFGRLAGPTHPPPTTWDQTTPQNTWKVEDSQVFSASLFASAQYAGADGDFTLTPKGGLSPQAFVDADGVWANSYEYYTSPQSQRQLKADASYFFNTGSLGHELKFGFTYLKAFIGSASVWPGNGSGGLAAQTYGSYFNCTDADGHPIGCAVITRNGATGAETRYWGAFLGDTVTLDRLTLNLGVRWDEQYGTNRASVVSGNATYPEILPSFVYAGRDRDFTWKDWQPRFGVAYALDPKQKTVLKASYSRYADALAIFDVSIPNNSQGAAYAYYAWNDANHNNLVEPSEVDTSASGFQFARNYNPQAPGNAALPFNLPDPELKAPRADEIIIGAEHELLPAFAVGVNYTYRRFTRQLYGPDNTYDPNTGYRFSSSDYEQYATLTGATPDGITYSQPVYRIKESVLDSLGLCTRNGDGGLLCQAPAGAFFINRRDFHTTYNGFEIILTKRLTNRWMARGSFVYNDDRQHIEGPRGCIDPTNLLLIFGGSNAQTCRNDDLTAVHGSKEAVFLNSRWQFNFVGLYQLPMGFAIAANIYGRQGYPINWYRQAPESGTDGLSRLVAVVPAGASRYENVFELDLRVEKTIQITSTSTATLSADVFNVTNENTVLQRQNRLEVPRTNEIREIQSPRIWRFGARLAF